jgi:hypothetical protein
MTLLWSSSHSRRDIPFSAHSFTLTQFGVSAGVRAIMSVEAIASTNFENARHQRCDGTGVVTGDGVAIITDLRAALQP